MNPMHKFWRETLRSLAVAVVFGTVAVGCVAVIYAAPQVATHWKGGAR